jgi:hypothetical protein
MPQPEAFEIMMKLEAYHVGDGACTVKVCCIEDSIVRDNEGEGETRSCLVYNM